MKLEVVLKGTHPLLMANERMVNRFDPLVKDLIRLTAIRSKTDDDLREIANLEFQIYMYYDDKSGPYLPGMNLVASIREGAKKRKHGKKVDPSVVVLTDVMPILYDGPRNMSELLKDDNVRFTTSVKQGTARLMKTRPIFRDWMVQGLVELDTEIFDLDAFKESLKTAGYLNGIGAYRPRYGRYEAVVTQVK